MIFEQAIFLSSDTSQSSNIINKSADGSTFTVLMNPSITIPSTAKNIKIYTNSVNFWYSFINISSSRGNNKLYITDDVALPSKYTLTIDDGLYSLSDLDSALNYQVIAAGLPSGTLTLTGDNATGKVIFTLTTGYQIYFYTNSMYVLLGTTNLQKIPSGGLTVATYIEKAGAVATFSSLSSVLYHCSLVNNSVLNGRGSDVIASVSPNVSVGSLQIDRPYNLVKIPANNLVGLRIDQIGIYITDQLGNLLNTNSESYGLTIIIEFEI